MRTQITKIEHLALIDIRLQELYWAGLRGEHSHRDEIQALLELSVRVDFNEQRIYNNDDTQ